MVLGEVEAGRRLSRAVLWPVGGALGGGVAAGAAWALSAVAPAPVAVGVVVVVMITVVGVPVAVRDEREHRIANQHTGAFAAGAVVFVGVLAIVVEGIPWGSAVVAALVVFGVYVVLGAAGRAGFGDAKFAAPLALLVGVVGGLTAMTLPVFALLITGVQQVLARAMGRAGSGRRAHAAGLVAAAVALVVVGLLAR